MSLAAVRALVLSATLLVPGCVSAPPALSGEEIVAAMLAHTQGARTVQIDMQAEIRLTPQAEMTRFEMTGAFRFNGDDYAGTLRTVGVGAHPMPANQTELVVVGGESWMRRPGMGGWEKSPMAIPVLDPLRGLQAHDVAYGGPEPALEGLHHIRILDGAALLSRTWLAGTDQGVGGLPQQAEVELLVNADGYPTSALITTRSALGEEAQLGFGVSLMMRFDYSNWGADFVIEAPL